MSDFDKELDALLERTQQELESLVKSEYKMKKADPGEESPAEQTPDGSSSEPPPPGPADDAPANDADPAQDASPSEAPPEAPPEETPGEGDPAAEQQPMSVDELTQEYLKLPPDQLKTHMEACKAALMAMAGGAPQGEPQAPPPAPMPDSAGPGPEMAMKSDKTISDLQKRVDELSVQLIEQNKSFETSIEKLALVLEKPLQKSVTRISQIPQKSSKTTTMSRDQINARLNEVSRTPDLKKSDRQAINQFVTGRAPIETIAHLLK